MAATTSIQPAIDTFQALTRQHFASSSPNAAPPFQATLERATAVWTQCSADLDAPSQEEGLESVSREGVKEAVLRVLKEETASVAVSSSSPCSKPHFLRRSSCPRFR